MSSQAKAQSEFVAEAQEIIDGLSRDLLALAAGPPGPPDLELFNGVFRGAHSLKGLSAMFGVTRLAELAHASEDLLDDVRLGRAAFDVGVIDLLLEAVDLFQRMLGEVVRGEDGAGAGRTVGQARALEARIQARRAPGTEPAGADPLDRLGLDPALRAVLTEYEEHRLRENARSGSALLQIRAVFGLEDFDKRLAALNVHLKPLGEVISTLPSQEVCAEGTLGFVLVFGTRSDPAEVLRAIEPVGGSLAVDPLVPPPPRDAPRAGGSLPGHGAGPSAASAGPVPSSPSKPSPADRRQDDEARPAEVESSLTSVSQTVRVDIHKLDRLMNTVGELALARVNLQRLAEALRAGALADPQQAGAELARETRGLERKLDELQKGILEVRMVPLDQVFSKLARMVRKVAREAGKQIELRVHGGDVELDKLIVEDLSDPLMHLIRNAIDHGIESPEARAAAGKPRQGTVSLHARQKGNHVVLEIGDDGAGIDDEAIKRAALGRGLTTAQAARELTRRDLLNFIFLPGFSTAKQVSALSGRGVGLDVVKTNIANLSGIIDVHTVPGQGTTFSITLPVTLAIIRALIVSVAGRTYALPLNSVLEILSIDRKDVRTIETREVIDVRGTTLPLVRLTRLFRLPPVIPPRRPFVVVVGLAQQRLGIEVDDLVGQQDVVVKPLGLLLASVRGISGATDLGSRRTVLVLDVGAIVEEVLAGERALTQAAG